MTISAIIDLFHLYTADSTELSNSEELDLANRVIKKIASFRPWESLKTQASGSISSSGTTYYISLPSDFAFITENKDNQKVIFVGANYAEYQVISFSDRRDYRQTDGYAYLDLANSRIIFTTNPSASGSTYEFDYCKVPTDSAIGDSPAFPPSQFHPMIAFAMAVDENIIEQFPKLQSYASDNQAKADSIMRDLSYFNSQLQIQ